MSAASDPADTPMFTQYRALKARCPDALLFFRMGDFYELFFDDAVVAARELELTLTSRNKADPNPIPMCGVPHHAAAGYLQKLTDRGYKVAIGEQIEDPAVAKGLVARDITRVVTPGVVFDPTALEAASTCFIAAVARVRDTFGVAFLDVSTGDLRGTDVKGEAALLGELVRFDPKELLLAPGAELTAETLAAIDELGPADSEVDAEAWTPSVARREVEDTLGVADWLGQGVRGDEVFLRAAGAALRYVRDNTGHRPENVTRLRPYAVHGLMVLDEVTRRNLEIFRTLRDGRRDGSLFGLLDRAATPMGSRRLREWLSFPLVEVEAIRRRQAVVTAWFEASDLREPARLGLREIADVERLVARVAQRTANPRDLAALRRSLAAVPGVLARLPRNPAIDQIRPEDLCGDVLAELETWIVEDPPIQITEGGLLRPEAHPELAELASLSGEGLDVLAELEERERAATGISSLKVRRNKVFGFYIEISQSNLNKVPSRYLRRQTLTNAERYITPELKEIEDKVLGADARRVTLEHELYVALRERVAAEAPRLLVLAGALATLDAALALAEVAERHRWVRPDVHDDGRLNLVAARHPVVEAALKDERFVPNDVRLDVDGARLAVVTGPNMAGKSTILRQTALCVLLAQVGSYVPADQAWIGVCDRIFTRVGASDDLARGRSTFMVEMAETASILHAATRRSLVVLDEIGRGTSTYDGLAIAWAVAEDLVDRVGGRALFATHYHELCELAETREGVVNRSVAVSESGDRVVFLRRLKEGGASRSYGIQCARLAGLPTPVVARAKSLLSSFERHAPRNERAQLSLFGGGVPTTEQPVAEDPLRAEILALDVDHLSPRDALATLYRLRELAEGAS